MVTFLIFVMIGVVVGRIIAYKCWRKRGDREGEEVMIMTASVVIGIVLGLGASFWGGSFVKKEIIVEKYFISPMFFDGKPIVALTEDGSSYVFQVKENNETETRLIKHNLSKEEIFFSLNEDEERYLEIKRSKACEENMWIWFFYNTGFSESKAVLKKGDNFLTLPKYCS